MPFSHTLMQMHEKDLKEIYEKDEHMVSKCGRSIGIEAPNGLLIP